MNNRRKQLNSRTRETSRAKNIAISIVILVELIAIFTVASFAWVETVSSIKITNATGTVGTIANLTNYTDMTIGGETGTIDLRDYFKASGDMHLAPCSSADGTTFYFPKVNDSTNFASGASPTFNVYRKGNVSDKNTAYLSATFRLKADTNADFFFVASPAISVSDDIRVSITTNSEGSTAAPETKIYANNASSTAVVNSTSGATGATTVEKFSDHTKGKSSTYRLFAVGANETKIVTINVWLQKKTENNTDLTANMSAAQAINNLGIISSLTPRHVTLIPTPTWNDNSPTYYAWCWDATNGDGSRLYKLELDSDGHYAFDYNGTYQKTTFVRAVPGCTVTSGSYSSWPFTSNTASNTSGYWNQTVDTKIPNDPVDPTYVIETISDGTDSKSTGKWMAPTVTGITDYAGVPGLAAVKIAYVTGQDSDWGTISAKSYIGSTTSTHIMEQTNTTYAKHSDTVHAWPGKITALTASANSQYAFVGWYTDAAGTTPASTSNSTAYSATTYKPNAPATATEITYYAKFVQRRKLTINRYLDGSSSSAACGTITIDGTNSTSGTSTYKEFNINSSVSFSATAATGYTLSGIYTTSGGTTTATSPVTLDASKGYNTTYYARFTTNTHTVTLNTIGSTGSTVYYGTDSANAGTSYTKTGVKYNTNVTIHAVPASGYEFVGWYTNSAGTTAASGSYTNADYTFTLGDANVTYYAKFKAVSIYLTGWLNNTSVTGTSNAFTASGSTFTLTKKFTADNGGYQYVTIYDGTNAYHPTENAGSGTAYSTKDTSPGGDYKWKVAAPKGATVAFTWDHSTKTLTWTVTKRDLYLYPGSNWTSGSPRFALYVYGNGEAWYNMTSVGNGYYRVQDVPTSYPNLIFVRMNGSQSANNWDNKWNQTGDLAMPSDKNLFTQDNSTWDGATTTWGLY